MAIKILHTVDAYAFRVMCLHFCGISGETVDSCERNYFHARHKSKNLLSSLLYLYYLILNINNYINYLAKYFTTVRVTIFIFPMMHCIIRALSCRENDFYSVTQITLNTDFFCVCKKHQADYIKPMYCAGFFTVSIF